MTTTLSANDQVVCRAVCQDGNQVSINSFHFRVVSVGSPAMTDNDVGVTFEAAVGPALRAILNNNATYKGVITQRIFPLPINVDTIQVANAGSGSAGAQSLPRQATGLTSWYTQTAGRAFRGRTYWPFPSVSDDTGDGVPSAGYVTRLAFCSLAFINQSAVAIGGRTGVIEPVIYHRLIHLSSLITLKADRTVWATQRRRGSYGRANTSPI